MKEGKDDMSTQPITLRLPGENDYFTREAYKTLRSNIQFCGKGIKVIAVTSVMENEGKSTISLHIGKSFAELGKKVLVIDADMRKSVMAGRNTTADMPVGLSEILTGFKDPSECIYHVKDLDMRVVFAGTYPPNPVELLSTKDFAELIEACRTEYDYVVIDCPPLGMVIDAAVIAPLCDGVILVMSSRKVHYKQALKVIEWIEKSGAKFLGVVRNHNGKPDKNEKKRKHKKDE